jgi:hypothetical protein
MTGKKLFATIFVLVALVVWGATTPNVTVAADQLRTQDRLLTQTPGSCVPACLPAPTKDQLQTRDRLHTSTTTVVSGAQLQQTAAPAAAVTATQPTQTTAPTVLQTRNQVQTQTHVVTPSGNMIQQRPRDQVGRR